MARLVQGEAGVFEDELRIWLAGRLRLRQFGEQMAVLVEAQMDRVFHLGPLRDNPKREYAWNRSRPSGVGQRGERTIEAIVSATVMG